MTAKEALNEILESCPKNQLWCAKGKTDTEQIWMRVVALRIKNGTAKPETLIKFFDLFGYDYSQSITKRV